LIGDLDEDSIDLFPKVFSESLGIDFFEGGILLSPLSEGREREGLIELMMIDVFSISFLYFFWGLLDLDLLMMIFFLVIIIVYLSDVCLMIWD
jgi:hypothetical protein